VVRPHALFTEVVMDRVAISSDGKFCNGKVNITAILYASWTVVASRPSGSDVVMTVFTSYPNDIQQKIPKKE
jgi:hypothetical protein